MTDYRHDVRGDELTHTQGSPSSPSPSSAHLDSAHGPSASGQSYDPSAGNVAEGVAEDSIRGAFPPREDRSPDNSDGPSWAPARKGRTPKGSGSTLGGFASFLWDSPEQRAQRKAAKAAGVPSQSTKGGLATGVAPKTKVSRRARLLGGKRGRASALMALLVLTAVLAVTNTALIVALFNRPSAEEAAVRALRESGQDFPKGQSAAWADQVVVDWATWDEADKDEREVRMAQYLTSGMDPQAGWNGRGSQAVEFTSVNPEPTVIDQNHALVDVAYRLEDSSRRCVSVPVYAYKPKGLAGEGQDAQWAFGLSGNPVPRPCAPRTGAMEDTQADATVNGEKLSANDELATELTSTFFPNFFAAWAASDANSLRQYTASGVTTIGLGGAMSSTPPPSVSEVVIMTPRDTQPKEGTVYYATVPVTWTMAGSSAQVTAVYKVPMKLVGDRWYVAGEPQPSTASPEASSGSPAERVSPEQGTDSEPSTPTPSTSPSPSSSSSTSAGKGKK